MNMANQTLSLDDIENNLQIVESLKVNELRLLWQQYFPRRPYPPTPALLRQQLTFNVQANRYGDINHETKILIHRAISAVDKDKQDNKRKRVIRSTKKRPAFENGTTLIRHWNGIDHTVQVHNKKFWYHNKPYRSLTQIAEVITGAHWSGPRFFGLNHHNQQHTHHG